MTSASSALAAKLRQRAPSAPVTPALVRQLRTARVCAPEHAAVVRSTCIYDTSVLPRWHQDDRGRRNASRGIHRVAAPGAYRNIRVWNGRQHWLSFVVPTAIATHRAHLRREQLSPRTFSLWARVESGYAQDQRTGRRCIVRPATVASVMGCTPNTVRKCRRIARLIGVQVVVQMGRMLTAAECWAARRRGSSQRGLSTETALTIPDPLVNDLISVTPTSGRATHRKTHLEIGSLHGLAAEKKEAAPPPRLHQQARRRRRARQLAADLVKIVPWLHGESPKRLAPALTPLVDQAWSWTARDVADAIDNHTLRTGRGPVQPIRIRTRPAVLLAAILRELDPQADHPRSPISSAIEYPPQPCRRSDCDGHGWIELDNHSVAKCPDCPPSIRSWRPDLEQTNDDGEPPF